jgi:hypothetical protein
MIEIKIENGVVKVNGNGNYGIPRQKFADKLHAMSDEEYLKFAKDRIWLSAYAINNPRSDYHWQADVCYSEAEARGKPELYTQAYEEAKASCS